MPRIFTPGGVDALHTAKAHITSVSISFGYMQIQHQLNVTIFGPTLARFGANRLHPSSGSKVYMQSTADTSDL
jgi:hypothetical protein